METQYDCISEARDMLQLLAKSEYYKDMATATLARHTPLNDGAIWAELCKLLDTPMQGYDYDSDNYDSAAYAIRAALMSCDYYYEECWRTSPSIAMHELAVELIDDVADGKTTPRKAAEQWASIYVLYDYGYPITDANLSVAMDVVSGRAWTGGPAGTRATYINEIIAEIEAAQMREAAADEHVYEIRYYGPPYGLAGSQGPDQYDLHDVWVLAQNTLNPGQALKAYEDGRLVAHYKADPTGAVWAVELG